MPGNCFYNGSYWSNLNRKGTKGILSISEITVQMRFRTSITCLRDKRHASQPNVHNKIWYSMVYAIISELLETMQFRRTCYDSTLVFSKIWTGFSVTVELNPTMQQFLLYSKIWVSKDNAIIWSISLIQPRQLATVISALAMAIRSMRVSRVKTTPSERISVFHLLKSDSIGFNTGLYAGRKTNVWLNLCAQLATTAQWWNLDCPWWSSKNHGLLRTNLGIALQERSRNAHLCTRQDECVHRETPLAHCGTYRESLSVTVCDNPPLALPDVIDQISSASAS